MQQDLETFVQGYWATAGYSAENLALLADLYETFRGRMAPDVSAPHGARRLTLGFRKAQALVSLADVRADGLVLNPFGGGGGIARLAALARPAEITLADIGYGDPAFSKIILNLDIYLMWSQWLCSLADAGCGQPLTGLRVRHWDARRFNEDWSGRFHSIIPDPPFGKSSAMLGISTEAGKDALYGFLRHSRHYLRHRGKVAAIYPKEWSSRVLYEAQASGLEVKGQYLMGRTTMAIVLSEKEVLRHTAIPEGGRSS